MRCLYRFVAMMTAIAAAVVPAGLSAQDVTIGPTPTVRSTPAGGAVFTDTSHGWSLRYGDPWRLVSDEGGLLVLTDDVSVIGFAALDTYGGDSVACLAGAAGDLARRPDTHDVSPATDAAGQPVRGEDAAAQQAYAVYLVTRGGEGLAVYLDCRTLARGRTVLLITQQVRAGSFNDENGPRQELLAGLDLPTDPCVAIEAYVDAARDRIARMNDRVDAIKTATDAAVYRQTADRIREELAAQQAARVPPGAEVAQRAMVDLLTAAVDEMEEFARAFQALTDGDFANSVPDIAVTMHVIDLIGQATSELDRLDAGCSAEPTTTPPAAPAYPCPPDQRLLDEWRQNAEETRQMAEKTVDPLDRLPFLVQADQWEQMAADWERSCAEEAG
jgi:hypothetical protein